MLYPKTNPTGNLIKGLPNYLAAVIFILVLDCAYGQEQTFPIWQSAIPKALADSSYSEKREVQNGELQRVSKVSIPTLTAFYPKPGTANGTAIVICPGGGYAHLAFQKEGVKVAQWLNTLGITAYVLKYRLPHDTIMADKTVGPLQDVQEALRLLRQNALNWGIQPDKIGILGFSAGGHLAASLSAHYQMNVGGSNRVSARPNFSILVYPVISMDDTITHQGSKMNLLGTTPKVEKSELFSLEKQLGPLTPPTFLVHATDDNSVPVAHSIRYYQALIQQGVPAEMHLYESGGHGFGLGRGGTHINWTQHCASWLEAHGFAGLKNSSEDKF